MNATRRRFHGRGRWALPTTPSPDVQAGARRVRAAGATILSFYYGDKQALNHVTFPVHDRKVTALIGPSGCGKSTLLRAFNRMHDLYPGNRYEGEVILYPEELNIVSPAGRPDARPAADRHGVPEAESVSEVDL